MISQISLDGIRQEVRDMALAEKTRLANLERSKKFEKRMQECERLNELLKADNDYVTESMVARPDHSLRANPFYMALEAQKKEREKYKQLLQLAIQNEAFSSEQHSSLYKSLK